MAWETTIARALHQRGAETLTILCNQILPACEPRTIIDDFTSTCNLCRRRSQQFLSRSGLPYRDLGDYVDLAQLSAQIAALDQLSLRELQAFTHAALPIGRLVKASVQRHLLQGEVEDTPENAAIYRRFVTAGLIVQAAATRILTEFRPTSIFVLNGLFYAEAIMMALAKKQGVSVWTYERASNRANALLLANNLPVIKYDYEQEWQTRSTTPLSKAEHQKLDDYLIARRRGKTGLQRLWTKMENPAHLNDDAPVAVLFTNVLWDTTVFESDVAFDSMMHWVHHTIDWFRSHPEYHLVIRVHPAEVRIPFKESRSPVSAQLPAQLPKNVTVFDADESINSYALLDEARVVLAYGSTIGLEAVLAGKYTIISGKVHYNYKGFTLTPSTIEEYENLLYQGFATTTHDLSESVKYARRYAYMHFFEIMVPLPHVEEKFLSYPTLHYNRNTALSSENSPYLSVICDAILKDLTPKNPEA